MLKEVGCRNVKVLSKQPGKKYLLSKVFHETLPQYVEHSFSGQRAHLWNIEKANSHKQWLIYYNVTNGTQDGTEILQ